MPSVRQEVQALLDRYTFTGPLSVYRPIFFLHVLAGQIHVGRPEDSSLVLRHPLPPPHADYSDRRAFGQVGFGTRKLRGRWEVLTTELVVSAPRTLDASASGVSSFWGSRYSRHTGMSRSGSTARHLDTTATRGAP